MKLVEIRQYPVKSCCGIALDTAQIDPYGVSGDREFVVVGENGKLMTQRNAPGLNLVGVSIAEGRLVLEAPGMERCEVDLTISGEPSFVTLYDGDAPGRCMGPHVAEWFSAYVRKPCRLVRSSDLFPRNMVEAAAHLFLDEQVRYPDCAPIHLISRASLAALNERSSKPVEMSRFRPNLVVDGDEGFVEDSFRRLRIGEVEFEYMGVAERCVIPAIAPGTRIVGDEPLKALRSFRMLQQKIYTGLAFGSYFKPVSPGTLHVGDQVHVLDLGTACPMQQENCQ